MKNRKVKKYNLSNSFQSYDREERRASRPDTKKLWQRVDLSGINIKRWLILISLGLVLIYGVFFSGFFRISNISVQGPNNELTRNIDREVQVYLKSRLLGSNWLLLNTADLKRNLENTFTGQEGITVDKIFPNKIQVKTDEQRSVMLWKTGPMLYRVAPSGKVISETNDKSPSNIPVIVDRSNIPVQSGNKVVSNDFTLFVNKLSDYFKSTNQQILQMSVGDSTAELTISMKAGYDIKMSTYSSADSQIKSLESVQQLLNSQKIKPQQYVDLRIDGKAFYK